MTRSVTIGAAVALAISVLIGGCGEGDDERREIASTVDVGKPGSDRSAEDGGPSDAAAATSDEEAELPAFDPANVVAGVDHPFMPLAPGSRWRYEAARDDAEAESEVVEIVVLGETREVMGVPCTVVRDTVTVGGVIVEDTYDWFAQDRDGNVWYMGEEVKNYEDGMFVDTEGQWAAGVDGALPGIIMWADPQPGAPYRQERAPGEAEDMARVVGRDGNVDVPAGRYADVLMVDEWNPLDPGVIERKSYARGVGLVLEEVVEGDPGRLELVEVALP